MFVCCIEVNVPTRVGVCMSQPLLSPSTQESLTLLMNEREKLLEITNQMNYILTNCSTWKVNTHITLGRTLSDDAVFHIVKGLL